MPYTLLATILLIVFVVILLPKPGKTPVIALIGIDYAAPTPPNAWAREDLESFRELSQTLIVDEVTGSWVDTDKTALERFKQLLGKHNSMYRGFRPIREPLIVYVSMPGLVNQANEPCLLPPGASPLDEEKWIKLKTVLGLFQEMKVPESRNKLLVLDCQQRVVDWRMGLSYNTFAERAKSLAESSTIPNLAILTSADVGQRSWSSPELRGTAFGKYFWLGVAGEADVQSAEPDERVTLAELSSYLLNQVNGWAGANRDAMQEPALIKGAESEEFLISYSLGSGTVQEHRATLARSGRRTPSLDPAAQIIPLWKDLERLRDRRAAHYAPGVLSEYENALLRLEQLAYGGGAYSKAASELRNRLAVQVAAPSDDASSPALYDHWSVIEKEQSTNTRITKGLHSLPLQMYFGQSSISQSDAVYDLWERVAGGSVQGAANRVEVAPEVFGRAAGLSLTQTLISAVQLGANDWDVTARELQGAYRLRSECDSLATPSDAKRRPTDARAHYYVRHGLEQLMPQLRDAEDSLFFRVEGLDGRQLRFNSVRDALRKVASVRDRVAVAHEINDQAWARLPHLAAWVCRTDELGSVAASRNEVDQVLELVGLCHELSDALSALAPLRDSGLDLERIAERLEGDAEDIQQRLGVLESFFSVYKNLGSAGDSADLKAIEAALASPLVESAGREQLLEKRDGIAANLHRKFFEAGASPAGEGQGSGGQEDRVVDDVKDAISSWRRSPLLAILAPSTEKTAGEQEGEVLARLDKECRMARQRLADPATPANATTPRSGGPAFLSDREPVSLAERRYRAAAPLVTGRLATSPVVRLRRFDLQQLMLWHTREQIDSFWHAVTPAKADSLSDFLRPATLTERLFERAAKSYLDIADRIVQETEDKNYTTPNVREQVQELEELLEQRVNASRHNPILGAAARVSFGDSRVFDVTLQFEPPSRGGSYPPGYAALHMLPKNLSGGEDKTRRTWGSVETPLGKSHQGQVRGITSSPQDVVLFFRGMTQTKETDIPLPNEPVLEFDWPYYTQQSVELIGDQPNPPSVVFILDCSGSMGTLLPRRDSTTGSRFTRMEAAVRALQDMLFELAGRSGINKPQIGVYFFGHRVKWKQLVSQGTDLSPAMPPPNRQIYPGEDIERVLSLGLFGPSEYGSVQGKLEKVEPWGFTPVYKSIIDALREFDGYEDRKSKSVIVITDGKNNYGHAAGVRPIDQPDVETVLREWDRMNDSLDESTQTPVFIVGFDVAAEEADDAREGFNTIAQHTGGRLFETDSGAALIQFLKERLDLNGYVIMDTSGRLLSTPGGDPKKDKTPLNTLVQLSRRQVSLPSQVTVEYTPVSKRVTLEGGEALKLKVNEAGTDIVAVPYDRDVVADADLISGSSGSQSGKLLRVHRPLRNSRDGAVRFRLSLQEQDSHFTPRPKFVWAEVTPAGTSETNRFYDTAFMSNTPVPVISFSVSNWPDRADEARVRFWCSDQPPTPAQSIDLARVQPDARGLQEFSTGVAGVELAVEWKNLDQQEKYLLVIREKHLDTSPGPDALRVWLEFKDPEVRPTTVRRSAGGSGVKHEYEFSRSRSPSEFAQQVTIQVASGAELKANALRVGDERGLTAPIFNENAAHSATFAE